MQVKGVDGNFCEFLKALAAAENRSVSQQVLVILVTNNTRHFSRVPGQRLANWAGA